MAYDDTLMGIGLTLDAQQYLTEMARVNQVSSRTMSELQSQAASFADRWSDITRNIRSVSNVLSSLALYSTFKGIAGAISSATSAVTDFSVNMETAEISMQYFVDGANKAAKAIAYLREMQQLAADTSFTTSSAINLSQFMAAMGIQLKTAKSVMTVINDAAAATGASEENMSRIVTALGQILTKGRLASEEIRQLANANIPIYEILQEQMGLTGTQIKNIGNYWIDANDSVVAILKGLQKKYSGAADEAAETMSGMANSIQDNALMIGKVATSGVYDAFEEKIRKVRDAISEYRDVAVNEGSVPLFANIVSDIDSTGVLGTKILGLIGNIHGLITTGSELVETFKPLVQMFGEGLYYSVNTLAMGINALGSVLVDATDTMDEFGISTEFAFKILAGSYITYKVAKTFGYVGQAAAAASMQIYNVGKSFYNILPATVISSRALTATTLTLLAGGAAALYLSGGLDAIINSMIGLSDIGDTMPSDFEAQLAKYQAAMDEYNSAISQYENDFNDSFESIASAGTEAFNVIQKKAISSAKASSDRWTASFDEVYTVPEQNSSTDDTTLSFPDLSALIDKLSYVFPAEVEIALEEPSFDWDSLWATDNDSSLKDTLKSLLPFAVTVFSLQMAHAFRKRFQEEQAKKNAVLGKTGNTSTDSVAKAAAKETVDAADALREAAAVQRSAMDRLDDLLKNGPASSDRQAIRALIKQIKDNDKNLSKLAAKVANTGTDSYAAIPDISGIIDKATLTLSAAGVEHDAAMLTTLKAWLEENKQLRVSDSAAYMVKLTEANALSSSIQSKLNRMPELYGIISDNAKKLTKISDTVVNVAEFQDILRHSLDRAADAITLNYKEAPLTELLAQAVKDIKRFKDTLKAVGIPETEFKKLLTDADKIALYAKANLELVANAELQAAYKAANISVPSELVAVAQKNTAIMSSLSKELRATFKSIIESNLNKDVDSYVMRYSQAMLATLKDPNTSADIKHLIKLLTTGTDITSKKQLLALSSTLGNAAEKLDRVAEALEGSRLTYVKTIAVAAASAAANTLPSYTPATFIQKFTTLLAGQLPAMGYSDEASTLADNIATALARVLMQYKVSSTGNIVDNKSRYISEALVEARKITDVATTDFSDSLRTIAKYAREAEADVSLLGTYSGISLELLGKQIAATNTVDNTLQRGFIDSIRASNDDYKRLANMLVTITAKQATANAAARYTLENSLKEQFNGNVDIRKIVSIIDDELDAADEINTEQYTKIISSIYDNVDAKITSLIDTFNERIVAIDSLGVDAFSGKEAFNTLNTVLDTATQSQYALLVASRQFGIAAETLDTNLSANYKTILGAINKHRDKLIVELKELGNNLTPSNVYDAFYQYTTELKRASRLHPGTAIDIVRELEDSFADFSKQMRSIVIQAGGVGTQATRSIYLPKVGNKAQTIAPKDIWSDNSFTGRITSLQEILLDNISTMSDSLVQNNNAVTKFITEDIYRSINGTYAEIKAAVRVLTNADMKNAITDLAKILVHSTGSPTTPARDVFKANADIYIEKLTGKIKEAAITYVNRQLEKQFDNFGRRILASENSLESLSASMKAWYTPIVNKAAENVSDAVDSLAKSLVRIGSTQLQETALMASYGQSIKNSTTALLFNASKTLLGSGNIESIITGSKGVGSGTIDELITNALDNTIKSNLVLPNAIKSHKRFFAQTIGEIMEHVVTSFNEELHAASGINLYNARLGLAAQIDNFVQPYAYNNKGTVIAGTGQRYLTTEEVKTTTRFREFTLFRTAVDDLIKEGKAVFKDGVVYINKNASEEIASAIKAYDSGAYYQLGGIASVTGRKQTMFTVIGFDDTVQGALNEAFSNALKDGALLNPTSTFGRDNAALARRFTNAAAVLSDYTDNLKSNTLRIVYAVTDTQKALANTAATYWREIMAKVSAGYDKGIPLERLVPTIGAEGQLLGSFGAAIRNSADQIMALRTTRPKIPGSNVGELRKFLSEASDIITSASSSADEKSAWLDALKTVRNQLVELNNTTSKQFTDVKKVTLAVDDVRRLNIELTAAAFASDLRQSKPTYISSIIREIDALSSTQASIYGQVRDQAKRGTYFIDNYKAAVGQGIVDSAVLNSQREEIRALLFSISQNITALDATDAKVLAAARDIKAAAAASNFSDVVVETLKSLDFNFANADTYLQALDAIISNTTITANSIPRLIATTERVASATEISATTDVLETIAQTTDSSAADITRTIEEAAIRLETNAVDNVAEVVEALGSSNIASSADNIQDAIEEAIRSTNGASNTKVNSTDDIMRLLREALMRTGHMTSTAEIKPFTLKALFAPFTAENFSGALFNSALKDFTKSDSLTKLITQIFESADFSYALKPSVVPTDILSKLIFENIDRLKGVTRTSLNKSFKAAIEALVDAGKLTESSGKTISSTFKRLIRNLTSSLNILDAESITQLTKKLDVVGNYNKILDTKGLEAANEWLAKLSKNGPDIAKALATVSTQLDAIDDAAAKLVQEGSVESLSDAYKYISKTMTINVSALKRIIPTDAVGMLSEYVIKPLNAAMEDAVGESFTAFKGIDDVRWSEVIATLGEGTADAFKTAAKQTLTFATVIAEAAQDAKGIKGIASLLKDGVSTAISDLLRITFKDVLGIGPVDIAAYLLEFYMQGTKNEAMNKQYTASASGYLSSQLGISEGQSQAVLDAANYSDALTDYWNSYKTVWGSVAVQAGTTIAATLLGSIIQSFITGAAVGAAGTSFTGPGAIIGAVVGGIIASIVTGMAYGDGAGGFYTNYSASIESELQSADSYKNLTANGYDDAYAKQLATELDLTKVLAIASSIYGDEGKMARGESAFSWTMSTSDEFTNMSRAINNWATLSDVYTAPTITVENGAVADEAKNAIKAATADNFAQLVTYFEDAGLNTYTNEMGIGSDEWQRAQAAMEAYYKIAYDLMRQGMASEGMGTIDKTISDYIDTVTQDLSVSSDLYTFKQVSAGIDEGVELLNLINDTDIDFMTLSAAQQLRMVEALEDMYKALSTSEARTTVGGGQIYAYAQSLFDTSGGVAIDTSVGQTDRITSDLEKLYEALGATAYDVSDLGLAITDDAIPNIRVFGANSADSFETFKDKLAGWTVALPDSISISDISASELSILAQAGIQITSSGVAFAQAQDPGNAGYTRDVSIAANEVSEYEKQLLAANGVTISSLSSDNTAVLDAQAILDNLYSAFYTVPDTFGNFSKEAATILAGYTETVDDSGNVISRDPVSNGLGTYHADTGMFEITNKDVLLGNETVSEWLAINDPEQKINTAVRDALLKLGSTFGADFSSYADAVSWKADFDADTALGTNTAAGIGGVDITKYGEDTVITASNVTDDAEEGVSKVLASDWFSIPEATRKALENMGVQVDTTSNAMYAMVDVSDTLDLKGDNLLTMYALIPDMLDDLSTGALNYLKTTGRLDEETGLLTWSTQTASSIVALGDTYAAYTALMPESMQKAVDGLKNINSEYAFLADSQMLTFDSLSEEQMLTAQDTANSVVLSYDEIPNQILYDYALAHGYITDEVANTTVDTIHELDTLKQDVSGMRISTAIEESIVPANNAFANAIEAYRQSLEDGKAVLTDEATQIGIAVSEALREQLESLSLNTELANRVKVIGSDNRWSIGNADYEPAGKLAGKVNAVADMGAGLYELFYNGTVYDISASSRDAAIKYLYEYINGSSDLTIAEMKKSMNLAAYANGGIATEDMYRVAEGNKKEAIIPMENPTVSKHIGSAMTEMLVTSSAFRKLSALQGIRNGGISTRLADERNAVRNIPTQTVDTTAEAILQRIMPEVLRIMTSVSSDTDKRPLYVGTLVADNTGLRELNKQMKIIDAKDGRRQ